MQNAGLAAVGLDWRYQAIETAPQDLAAAVKRLRSGTWVGANVTIPLKEVVVPLLDRLDPSAARTSAVNTIVVEAGRLAGYNTDVDGFLADLKAVWPLSAGGRALILGAGGAARAVAFGLAQHGLRLCLIARSAARASALAGDIRRMHPVDVAVAPWEKRSFAATGECRLVVNATPLGMPPNELVSPWPDEVPLPAGAFVYDLVYSPRETRLVRHARSSGLQAVTGAGMLLEQGARSFELWTGLLAPRERMRAALKQAIGEISVGRRAAHYSQTSEVRDA